MIADNIKQLVMCPSRGLSNIRVVVVSNERAFNQPTMAPNRGTFLAAWGLIIKCRRTIISGVTL